MNQLTYTALGEQEVIGQLADRPPVLLTQLNVQPKRCPMSRFYAHGLGGDVPDLAGG